MRAATPACIAFVGLLACAETPARAPASTSPAAPLASASTVGFAAPAPTASAVVQITSSAPAPSASATASNAAPPSAGAGGPSPDAENPQHIDEENVYAARHATAPASAPLFDESQKPLPQTDTRPSLQSPSFDARMRLVARAITTGDVDAALPAFFPSVAYAQVKDIPQPEKDWQARLVSAFRRDLSAYRKELGPDAAQATFVGVDVPESKAKLMRPGSEGNRVSYYRVLRSKLKLRTPNGKDHGFEITSMISWRGEWYVVHLKGFR